MEWIKCNALFEGDDEIDYESLGIPNNTNEMWREFCFKLSDVESFNLSEKETATLAFKSGFRITTDITIQEMKEIIIESGSQIM